MLCTLECKACSVRRGCQRPEAESVRRVRGMLDRMGATLEKA
jgi:hypothetical protein